MNGSVVQFGGLPPEVKLLIFDKLDFKSRVNCSSVCREWNDLAMNRTFLSQRVLMKPKIGCGCYDSHCIKQETTVRYLTSVLMQSSRSYKSMSIVYRHETVLGINSILNLFEHFKDLTFLQIEQKHRQIHDSFLRRIFECCPRLRCLHLNVMIVCGTMSPGFIENELEELILEGPYLNDFRNLIILFSNVPKLHLHHMRIGAQHIESLVKFMPQVETLYFCEIVTNGTHPFQQIKYLTNLREFTITASMFTPDFGKWPKLPRSVRTATIKDCANVQMLHELHERWNHCDRIILEGNEDKRYAYLCRGYWLIFNVNLPQDI